jgi:hypothetical protein
MIYDNSAEEQKYLSSIRRERESFERLIRERSVSELLNEDSVSTLLTLSTVRAWPYLYKQIGRQMKTEQTIISELSILV